MVAARYFRAFWAGMGGKIAGLGFDLLALWLTTLLLDKAAFGAFAIALATATLVSLVLMAGPQGIVLYRCSQDAGASRESAAYAGQCYRIVTAAGTALAGGLVLAAGPVARVFGEPALAFWLPLLAPLVLLNALRLVMVAREQAEQRSGRAAFFRDALPFGLRAAGVGAAYLGLGGGPHAPLAVGVAYNAGVAFTLLPLLAFNGARVWRLAPVFTAWDGRYGLKLVANGLMAQPRQSGDTLLVGALSTAAAAAEYTVALRLANLLLMTKQALDLLLVPRMGWLWARHARETLYREYDACRAVFVVTALAGMAVYFVFGAPLLALFGEGDYTGARPVLLILSLAFLVRGAFGSNGLLLKMVGFAGWTLVTTGVGMVVLVLVAVAAVPALGAVGGGIAMLCAETMANVVIATILKYRAGLATMRVDMLGVLGVTGGVTGGAAAGLWSGTAAAAAAIACAAAVLVAYRHDLRALVRGDGGPPG